MTPRCFLTLCPLLQVIFKQYHENIIRTCSASREIVSLLTSAGSLGGGRFGVPTSITKGEGVDLSRLRSLVVGIDSSLDPKDGPPLLETALRQQDPTRTGETNGRREVDRQTDRLSVAWFWGRRWLTRFQGGD